MADWSPYTHGLSWPQSHLEARRQKRLADFVRPHLQTDEEIVAILSGLYPWPTSWGRFAAVALAVTSHRLILIRQRNMILLRSTKILGTYPRDGLKVEWNRDARVISSLYREYTYGRLSVIGSFSEKEWWAGGSWRQHRVATVCYDTEMIQRRS
jgi:hypothetical protein